MKKRSQLPAAPPALPQEGYVKINVVSATVQASRSTIYRWINLGLFPKPKMIGIESVRWDVAELRAWMSQVNSGVHPSFKGIDAKTDAAKVDGAA